MGIIVVYNDKIYTSYYSNVSKHVLSIRQIGVSATIPLYFEGSRREEYYPSWDLINGIKYGEITEEEFERAYREEVLSRLNPVDEYEKLRGKVLCCWEKKGDFCHRHIILKWLGENLGEHIIGGEL